MRVIIKRNLRLYFRDKNAVFFSLMAIIIIIVLYAVFLGDAWLDNSMKDLKHAQVLMNSWLVSGLLAVTSVTTTMGALGTMIDDKVRKINKDFDSSPMKRSSIAGGYIGSSFLIGVIMSLITAVAAEIYIVSSGGQWLTCFACIKVFFLVLLTALTNTSLVCFAVSFFKSHREFNAASTIIGTLIGFLTGIYLPVGALPSWVQTIVKLFPVSHAASLLRQVLMEVPMKNSFDGIPVVYLEGFKEYMGVTFRIKGYDVPPVFSIILLLCTSAVFYRLSLFLLSGKRSS